MDLRKRKTFDRYDTVTNLEVCCRGIHSPRLRSALPTYGNRPHSTRHEKAGITPGTRFLGRALSHSACWCRGVRDRCSYLEDARSDCHAKLQALSRNWICLPQTLSFVVPAFTLDPKAPCKTEEYWDCHWRHYFHWIHSERLSS